MSKTRAHVLISGRVQGVYFRGETQDMALSLSLTGWVKNLPDGRVEAIFEGDEKAVKEAVEWCHKGPSLAKVEKVDVKWGKATEEFTTFSISYGY